MTQKEAEVILKVNSKEAREKLEKLEAQAADLRKKFAEAFRKGDTRGIHDTNKQLQKVNKEINNMRTNAANIRAAMVRLDEASPRELQRTIKLINNELNSGRVKRGTKEWDEYVAKLKEVNAELAKVKEEMQPDDDRSFFDKIKDGINDWGASAATASAAFAGVAMSGKAAVQAYADMEAEEANVRKFTGMTADEVAALNEEFKKMDTRTSREELNKLAQQAGRLGKTSPEDVLGFVKAADQLNVALDDLGDDATLTLSKLTGIFGDEKRFGTEQSLLKVGSVINELSQNCSASAPYLAEFSSRLGGIAAQSNMTISQVMAFAAVLDSNNLAVEASSTAVGQLITTIYQEPAKIAKAAGMDVAKFSELVKTDMNGALIELFEQLHQFGGMESLASVFDSMGTDGARAIPVLTALAGHVDTLKWQQEQANIAFKEGTSVTKEFNVQNNTVQAQLDKAKKGFNEMAVALGEKLLPVMRYCISGTSLLMRVISVLVNFIIEYKGVLISLGAAVLTYTIHVKGATIATKAWGVVCKVVQGPASVLKASVLLLRIAYYNLTGQVTRASAAMRIFNSISKLSPFGIFIAAITAAIGLLITFIHRAGETKKAIENARKEQEKWKKSLTDISEAAAQAAASEESRLKSLYQTAINQAKSTDERRRATQQLQNLYPDYFKNLSTEQIMVGDAKDQYDKLRDSIIQAARARAAAAKIEENESKLLELESQLENQKEVQTKRQAEYDKAVTNKDEAERTHRSSVNAAALGDTREMTSRSTRKHVYALKNASDAVRDASDNLNSANNAVAATQRQIDIINEANQTLADKYKVSATTNTQQNPTGGVPTTSGGSPSRSGGSPSRGETAQERQGRKAKEALKKDLDERKSMYQQAEAENLLLYISGQQSYADYLAKKKELDEQYTDDIIKIHEAHNKIDIAAYGNALKSKADLMKKQEDEEQKRKLDDVEAQHNKNTDAFTEEYFDPSSSIFQNQKALNQLLLQEDLRYLIEKRDLYIKDSEEWIALDREYQDRLKQGRLDKQKELVDAIEKYREQYGDAGRTAAYNAEIEMLDLLHKKGIIKEEEYQKNLEKIRAKYRSTDMSESFQKFDNIFSRLTKSMPDKMSFISKVYTAWLNGLSEEERAKVSAGFEKGFDNVVSNICVEGLGGVLSLIEGFNEASEGNWSDFIGKIGEMAENATNIIGGIMSNFSSYWNAQRDIEVANIEKRYDREIDAAGKNSKKKKKLEEQKEADIAKVKKKYNDRAMKMEIAQAIAQTAANALGAYGAMVKIPVVGPALAAVAAATALAAGMIQVATIKKQHEAQAVGYYEGGFTSRDPNNRKEVGVVHANEFVANHEAVANPALSPLLRLIDTAQRNNTVGSLTAADVSNALGQGSGVSARGEAATAGTDSALRRSLVVMADTNSATKEAVNRLSDALEDGIEAKVILDGEEGFHKKYRHFLKLQNNPKR